MSHELVQSYRYQKSHTLSSQEADINSAQTAPDAPPQGYKYDWQFLSFFSLWVAKGDHDADHTGAVPLMDGTANQQRTDECGSLNATGTQILLCFDDSARKIKETMMKYLQASSKESIGKCSFAILDTLVKAIVFNYDRALWGFREPVRIIEKVKGFPRYIKECVK